VGWATNREVEESVAKIEFRAQEEAMIREVEEEAVKIEVVDKPFID